MNTKNKVSRLLGVLLVLILPLGSPSIAKADLSENSSPSDSWAVALGDLDGDGDLDAFVGNQDSVKGTGPEGFNEIWFNNGDATFTYSSQQLGQEDTEAVKLADLDYDGDLDAFTANSTGVIIWINDGTGIFTQGPTLGSANAYAVDLGDLDGDGDLDAFVGVLGSKDQVWINQGGMNFMLQQQVGNDEQARHVALDDLDGDSDLDAFVVNHFNQTNIIYLNDGTAHFVLGQTIPNNDAVDLSLGDLDGDGDIDAYVGNSSGEADDLYVNDGTGNFSQSSQVGNSNTEATALGDLDGDGDLDIYMGDGFGGANRIWFNNGDGTFFDSDQSLGNFDTFGTALGDLDGDGDLDIFDANKMAETVWLNDDAGTFSFGQFLGEPPPLPEPTLQVEINHDWVLGWNWPSGHLIRLIVNGVEEDAQVVYDIPWGTEVNFNSWDTGFNYDLQPGDEVTLEDTVTGETKTHTALNIAITDVDIATKTVQGYAVAGRELVVWADPPCDEGIWVTADVMTGTWSATFSCDEFSAGEYIFIEQYDIDSTTVYTSFFWTPPSHPTLYAEINFEWVEGWYWPLGKTVTLTIDDPDTPEEVDYTDAKEVSAGDCPVSTCVRFDLWEAGFNLEPGHIVTLTDGTTTITHTALNMGITQVNVTDNTVTGFAERDTDLVVSAHEPCWTDVMVTADGDDYKEVGLAYWQADFNGVCNLNVVEFVNAVQQGFEEDGVSTGFYWEPPYLGVDIYYDTVSGWSWLPGSEVTLTIDSPDINGTENYTLTKTVGVDTDSTPDTVLFDFRGEFYIQPGHIVTLSDGGISIVYEVEYLEVTQVDPDSKTVQGMADPGDEVLVILSEPWTESVVSAGENGVWEAYFDALEPETWGMAQIPAGYENHTFTSWESPMPTTYNINPWWSEMTVRTGDEVILNLGWAACTPQLVGLFQKTAHIDITINGEPLYAEGDEALYWNPIEPFELNGCKIAPKSDKPSVSRWQYTLSPFESGIYEIYVHYWLDHPAIDGVDGDGDGHMDIYEGTLVENTITIVVK